MKHLLSLQNLRQFKKTYGTQKIGFIPTMGALHQGHLSLVTASQKQCDLTLVSIFVNPTQFGKGEDFDRYPRTESADLSLLEKQGCDAVFLPTPQLMYPRGPVGATQISVPFLSNRLCGKTRPGHFQGVCMIVGRLLNLVEPDFLFLGEKDFQQVTILNRMCQDLFMKTQIVPCPILREKDGLALSSRNMYLNTTDRKKAPLVYEALSHAVSCFKEGENRAGLLCDGIKQILSPTFKIDYIQIVNPKTLKFRHTARSGDRIMVAAYLGQTRLIDNARLP